MANLVLPLNGIYFDQIAAGTKLEEYRLASEFWSKRLRNRSYDAVVLTRGYPKGGGVEGATRLTRQWRGFTEKEITHPHFGDKAVKVFAICVRAQADRNPEGHDREAGHGAEHESPVVASSDDAPDLEGDTA